MRLMMIDKAAELYLKLKPFWGNAPGDSWYKWSWMPKLPKGGKRPSFTVATYGASPGISGGLKILIGGSEICVA